MSSLFYLVFIVFFHPTSSGLILESSLLELRTKREVSTVESKCNSSIVGGEDSMIFNNYSVGASCFYIIEAPENKVIELDLKQLQFGSASCEEESIHIYQGLTNHGLPLSKICSDTANGIQPFHENTLFIEYRNPSGQEGERFLIQYSFVSPPSNSTASSPVGGNSDCSGFYKDINTANGEMIYTAPEYQSKKECVIVVRNTLLPHYVVQIHFNYFDMENSDNCTNDSLTVLSGERNDSYSLKGPYCGKSLDGRTFITNGNSIRLEFRTDDGVASRGFQAVISFIYYNKCLCKENLKCVRQGFEKRCIRGDNCIRNTCLNGGTCLISKSQQTCYCPTGYQGDDCSENNGSTITNLHFIKAPIDKALQRNEPHVEECIVDAPMLQEVYYQWTLNGVLIEEYSETTGFGSLPRGILEIRRFNDKLDGNYSCIAQTASGIAEHTFELRLVDCDVKIERGPQYETKKIGDYAMFMCLVNSRPRQIRWKKNDVYIDYSKHRRFQLIAQDMYLRIKNIQMEDAGRYMCEVEGINGCYSYEEGGLTVINLIPSNKYCGVSVYDEHILASAKISGGLDALPMANPWHVTLRTQRLDNDRSFCGGTLISQRFVLTAAQCILEFEQFMRTPWSQDSVVMILGTTDCNGERGTYRRPKRYYIHPDYNKRTRYDSDIALIELDSEVEFSNSIRPICLEPASYNDRVFFELSNRLSPAFGKVAGCGSSRLPRSAAAVLQEVFLPYVRREQCEESLHHSQNLTDAMICVGFSTAGKGDTCRGDSGEGLVMETGQRWVQTGITSLSVGRCDTGNYGIYTNVGNFYNWINDIAKISEEEVPTFLSIR